MKKTIGLLVLFLCLSCTDKDDNAFLYPQETTVQNFIWQGLNQWYFWQAEAKNLGDDRFATNEDYVGYLKKYPDPENFFYNTCHRHSNIVGSDAAIDRFSFVNSDYKTLVNQLNGISKSNGVEFGLVRINQGKDLYGYVKYIIPNSNASNKAIARGDIFTRVNGQQLTDENYTSLLFGENDTYTLGMADISGSQISDNNKEVTLTKEVGLVEDPIFVAKTIESNGIKIGYLMYNGFTQSFNESLNNTFGGFKNEGVTELILDLRYNPGGSVYSSQLLASMIYGTNTEDLYIRQRWNDKIQPTLKKEQLEDYFTDKTASGTPINSLNLSKVYVLATNSTASASELVMNGLDPYMDIVHIGTTTRGKNEFSVTMVDDRENDYIYHKSREGKINPKNRWAMQPLMGRNENSVGFSDYTSGLLPDITLNEDLSNMGSLGDLNEPLLARAIQEIAGTTGKWDFKVNMPIEELTNSKMFTSLKDHMILDKSLK
ncbi:C-terminal processing protease CtpA/Prc, contains a PDZ domain [Arenibacter nanhaiticus]|uniref:C-terminal processing protease CtpA/Prc, contains a PDZ domain n=1 Tax=Arenibacter nanhaiticus TaxID=558155 RepID=A0A1M6EE51_9FLAO|nr:S41 family peptidase [Arenibacter nanhaiticus]SHI83744.1 C-terminal processing protease CtpA/Prc, contains a PDZ domain [Arenibacter nanhaiticus]